jgi:hypothetical protein
VNLLKVHFWKKNSLAKVVNLGISGDRILNVINRLENWINPYTEKSDNEIILIFAI